MSVIIDIENERPMFATPVVRRFRQDPAERAVLYDISNLPMFTTPVPPHTRSALSPAVRTENMPPPAPRKRRAQIPQPLKQVIPKSIR
jgi:hypothetical protein